MAESLLSFSEVLLFGRKLHDIVLKPERLRVEVAATTRVDELAGHITVDGQKLGKGDKVLLTAQGLPGADEDDDDDDDRTNAKGHADNGIWRVNDDVDDADDGKQKAWTQLDRTDDGDLIKVRRGSKAGTYYIDSGDGVFEEASEVPGNQFLRQQFLGASLARIYGFSWEGAYYEFDEPVIFLVHGRGKFVNKVGAGPGGERNAPGDLASRAPNRPDRTGVAAADFQFADDIRVWSYDKADYTVRMDVMTGMFEQVLLDVYFGFDEPGITGAKVSGAKVSGAKVSGAKVSGAKVSGAKARGPGD